ncbi:hypothetical protein COL65_20295 [Priestia aryabhattai]|uniref:hypothetical protein n=1 Tax=Priestia aryabhattai TaxID=412384 RepID=UPI000BF49A73|nr:hypothetical protein [Priestia aryabhattai]PGA16234.1 hypothetical protein COL65_20295 [Priestia aryabhattai]
MANHMKVQQTATKRNDYVEIMVDYILLLTLEKLKKDDIIISFEEPLRQKEFIRQDTSDVFDHYFKIKTKKAIDGEDTFQIWGQTTCYKGNALGRPESNKTYEIRETLIEALSLRHWLIDENEPFRTFHITMGPTNYTYGWFASAKQNAFDLSLYPEGTLDTEELFTELFTLFLDVQMENEYYEKLEDVFLAETNSTIRNFIGYFHNKLYDWVLNDLTKNKFADKQASLLIQTRKEKAALLEETIKKSKLGGTNIKGRVIQGKASDDEALNKTIEIVSQKNPFLREAWRITRNWKNESASIFSPPKNLTNLEDYIYHLWTNEHKLINRRLLLRIHTEEVIEYIQDLDIKGVTEHNLYSGDHKEGQIKEIVNKVYHDYIREGIRTPEDLYNKLISPRAKQLLSAAWYFEIRNGTNIKPSFFYVEEVLINNFDIVTFVTSKLEKPIAYHKGFGEFRVSPYQNLKVIIDKETKEPLGIIKAKYFSKDEFSRRAKEEGYVGLTTTFKIENDEFINRYKDIPLIMFVDMDENLVPPERAIAKLINTGWTVFFGVDDLISFLEKRRNK